MIGDASYDSCQQEAPDVSSMDEVNDELPEKGSLTKLINPYPSHLAGTLLRCSILRQAEDIPHYIGTS